MREDELLAAYRPWLRAVAARMTRPEDAEDLAQEGWIAMWRSTRSHDGDRAPQDWWLKSQAIGRMKEVVTRAAEKSARHAERNGHWASLDALISEIDRVVGGGGWYTKREFPAPATYPIGESPDALRDPMSHAEMAYHYGQLRAALDRLTPNERRYVVLRFWGDVRTTELKEFFGYDPNGIWKQARPKLRRWLAHLDPDETGRRLDVRPPKRYGR